MNLWKVPAAMLLVAALWAGGVQGCRKSPPPATAPAPKTIEQLSAELESGDPAVRRQAADELGRRLGGRAPKEESP